MSYLFDEAAHEVGLSHGCDYSVAHEIGGGRADRCGVNSDRE
jgi:hypothetical protein